MCRCFSEPPPRGGTGFSKSQKGCHLIGVCRDCRVPRAGLEACLGVHITFVSGLFIVVVAREILLPVNGVQQDVEERNIEKNGV